MMRRLRQRWALVLVSLGSGATAAWGAGPECFRSPAEAAAQSGVHDVAGYRLESVDADAFAEVRWAKVRSCVRAAQPAMLLPVTAEKVPVTAPRRGLADRGGSAYGQVAAAAGATVMEAGRRVTLVIHDETMRVEVGATALSSGRVGQRMKVRLDQVAAGAEERIAEGVVRGAALVEVTR